jgi:hypothetical protein
MRSSPSALIGSWADDEAEITFVLLGDPSIPKNNICLMVSLCPVVKFCLVTSNCVFRA